jgi:hypothetical protein
MDTFYPKINNNNAGEFLELYKEAGDLLEGSTEFPRIPEETPLSYLALIDFYLLGVNRSYAKLARYYETQESAPTRSAATIKTWSYRYRWIDRIEEYENTIIAKQLALVEKARLEFIGKQIGALYLMEKSIVDSAPHLNMDSVTLASFTRAIERFTDTAQKVFDMTPTQRIETNNLGKLKSTTEGLNELASLNEIIKEREKLKEVVNDELNGAQIVTANK